MSGVGALGDEQDYREHEGSGPSLESLKVRASQEGVCVRKSASALILDFPASRNRKNQRLLLRFPRLRYFTSGA